MAVKPPLGSLNVAKDGACAENVAATNPLREKTDLCCRVTSGGECVFEEEEVGETKKMAEGDTKGDGIGELRVDMDLTTGYEPDETAGKKETPPGTGTRKKATWGKR